MPSSLLSNRKRKLSEGKGTKKKKPNKPFAKPKNPSLKMKKLFRKRAKAYNSDEEEDDEDKQYSDDEEDDDEEREEAKDDAREDYRSSDEDDARDGSHLGITRFAEGCRAFRTAFLNIMKKHLPNDPLGPILSAHKKLVAEKLLEEETEHKAKGEAKKEKHLAGEKGHVKPSNFLDTKEKLLISTATKGVVKLFNAVNKAQNPQKGLNPSRSKDAKELAKRRKQTFLSELKKTTTGTRAFSSSKVTKPTNKEEYDEPGWAPLRDNYMLNNSKSKDWDKMADSAAAVDQGRVSLESSSDED